MAIVISKGTLEFLKDVSKNNNREWFSKNKDRYLLAHANMIAFADALLSEMQKHDVLENTTGKECLYRIYRDTRFSKDKTPYKDNFGGGFRRVSNKRRGGYFFQVGPGVTLAAGGFFSPGPADLKRIRQDIDLNYGDWKKILAGKKTRETFGEMRGVAVSTAPQGYQRTHPAIELLRHKQFYLERKFTDKEVLQPDFLKVLNQTFKNLRPYFDYMSDVLTTDLNGVSVLNR